MADTPALRRDSCDVAIGLAREPSRKSAATRLLGSCKNSQAAVYFPFGYTCAMKPVRPVSRDEHTALYRDGPYDLGDAFCKLLTDSHH